MAVLQTITLNQKDFRVQPMVYGVQGDTGRVLKMIIADVEYSAGSGELQFTRSDGSYYAVPASFASADNSFSADITQALTQPGLTECVLKVTAGGGVVGTYQFRIAVQAAPEGLPFEQLGITRQDLLDALKELMYADQGQPTPVESTDEMTDHDTLYLYLGSEEDYANGHIYAWIDDGWMDIGMYGQQALPYIMPEMYGAKGDIFTDDTAAIQRAVNAAAALGKPLVFAQNGVYNISGTVNITEPVVINGNHCIIQLTSHAERTNVFYVNYSSEDFGAVIRNFRVMSYRAHSFVNGGDEYPETQTDNNSFIYVHNGDNGLIENIESYEAFCPVFFAHYRYDEYNVLKGWTVRGIRAKDCLFGVHLANIRDTVVSDFEIQIAPDADLYCHCIYINGYSSHITVRNGRLVADLEIAEDMENAPTQPLVDTHQTDIVYTMTELSFENLDMRITDPTESQLYAFNLQDAWLVNVRDCKVYASRLVRAPLGIRKFFYNVDFTGYMIGYGTQCRFFGGHFVCTGSPALHNLTNCYFYGCQIEGDSFILWDSFTGVLQNCALSYTLRCGRFRSGKTVNLKMIGCDLSATGNSPDSYAIISDDNTVSGYLTCIGNSFNGATDFADAYTLAIVDTSGGGSRAAVFANNEGY